MMYPVRTTLLLSVDDHTAAKFLRDEAYATENDRPRFPARPFLARVLRNLGDWLLIQIWHFSVRKSPIHN